MTKLYLARLSAVAENEKQLKAPYCLASTITRNTDIIKSKQSAVTQNQRKKWN